MSSPLSTIPVRRRQRAAATAGLAAAVFVPVGVLPWTTDAAGLLLRMFSTVVLIVAVLLGLVAWGLLRSTRVDAAEAAARAEAESILAEAGALGCGHDHDPEEMHVVCPETAHECTHSCDTCVLRTQ